jgi:hypothetical protein
MDVLWPGQRQNAVAIVIEFLQWIANTIPRVDTGFNVLGDFSNSRSYLRLHHTRHSLQWHKRGPTLFGVGPRVYRVTEH